MKSQEPLDSSVKEMLDVAKTSNVSTVWDRYQSQLPQCGFGESGICCRNCLQGPCRINPFGDGPDVGVCGANADTIVARNLIRGIAGGAASHSGHGKHLAHVLKKVAKGEALAYEVKEAAKLNAVAARLGIPTENRSTKEIAGDVAQAALDEFSERETPNAWAATTLTAGRIAKLNELKVIPYGIDSIIAEIMHRTTLGVDADPVNLLLGGIKGAIADFAGCHLGTDLADILFGIPAPTVSEANMGVIREKAVNIALHGHNPLLSDMIVATSREPEILAEAKAAGAEQGIQLMGICCTGNEVLMRHGVPTVTTAVSQELPILTGALDAMIVDYQCVYPSLPTVAACFGTPLITTMDIAKIPGATHIEFDEDHASEKAREIIRIAITAFKRRLNKPVHIPPKTSKVVAGFSTETIVGALAKLNADDPLQPLVDNIVNGNIQGVVLFAGCSNIKVGHDQNFVAIAKELIARNILVLATGCGAGAFARNGLLDPQATLNYAGDGLKAVLTAIGEANGLNGPLPPVLHMGSCVDNSRPVDIAVALANKLKVDIPQLPVVASAPEYKTEKALAIGTWAATLGLPTHLGLVPPVVGSKLVTRILTQDIKELTGGYFIVEPDPILAAEKIFSAIQERRQKLNISTRSW
ncbi:anaerobic carbon-monoxide dehydrogenase catalytic subunit [Sporomusa sp. KB1]|jgi:carbon-monoxide dehydrogenase catalytic subunit|uniref:anaerobic carbon-monoxide dehydrogenase catalytic subunit n=1 Tax=Sporomusa sp. KB1 TaxID=943346 RepID=UPI0011A79FD7|nr:anaerobic carbon-monoxide dehydrogenase catalytic subunit [Sporomusa sp. KB1]TWH46295.1 Ni-dependent carbon monoxide dehydrogenase precursor [Sporomusa sp. KB1]